MIRCPDLGCARAILSRCVGVRPLRAVRFRASFLCAALLGAALLSAAPLGAQSLNLDRAITLAVDASYALERAWLEVDAAEARLDEARARSLPRVRATAGTAFIANPPDGITIPAGEFGSVSDPGSTFPTRLPDQPVVLVPDPENLGLSISATFEQSLFTWGKLRAAESAARLAVEASSAARSRGERDVRRGVTIAYAGAVAARRSLPAVEAIVATLEELLADAQRQFDAGAITRGELLAREADLASSRAQLVRSRQAVRSAELSLAWLVGARDGTTPGTLAAMPEWPALPAEQELVRRARAGDPRLAELRATSDRASIQVDVSRASRPFLPDLGLSVEAEIQGQRIPLVQANWIDTWDANLTVSIGASVSLFDGGANRAATEVATAQFGQARSAVAEYAESLPLQIRMLVESLAIAEAQLAEANAREARATEDARVARVSFENELITRSQMLAAQIAVEEARLAAIASELESHRARAELEYLVGPLR